MRENSVPPPSVVGAVWSGPAGSPARRNRSTRPASASTATARVSTVPRRRCRPRNCGSSARSRSVWSVHGSRVFRSPRTSANRSRRTRPVSHRASQRRRHPEYGFRWVPMTVSGPRSVATVTAIAAWCIGRRTGRARSTRAPVGTNTATGWPNRDRARYGTSLVAAATVPSRRPPSVSKCRSSCSARMSGWCAVTTRSTRSSRSGSAPLRMLYVSTVSGIAASVLGAAGHPQPALLQPARRLVHGLLPGRPVPRRPGRQLGRQALAPLQQAGRRRVGLGGLAGRLRPVLLRRGDVLLVDLGQLGHLLLRLDEPGVGTLSARAGRRDPLAGLRDLRAPHRLLPLLAGEQRLQGGHAGQPRRGVLHLRAALLVRGGAALVGLPVLLHRALVGLRRGQPLGHVGAGLGDVQALAAGRVADPLGVVTLLLGPLPGGERAPDVLGQPVEVGLGTRRRLVARVDHLDDGAAFATLAAFAVPALAVVSAAEQLPAGLAAVGAFGEAGQPLQDLALLAQLGHALLAGVPHHAGVPALRAVADRYRRADLGRRRRARGRAAREEAHG